MSRMGDVTPSHAKGKKATTIGLENEGTVEVVLDVEREEAANREDNGSVALDQERAAEHTPIPSKVVPGGSPTLLESRAATTDTNALPDMSGAIPSKQHGYDDKEEEVACSRYFRLSLASTCCFVYASVLYVWLAFIGLDYEKKASIIPQSVKDGDDDAAWYEYGWADDDYVYVPTNSKFLISKYMIVYFYAALGFVFTGVLDWFIEAGFLSLVMILAGLTGLTSAIVVERNEWLAIIFNSISVHLFLVEAVGLFYKHFRSDKAEWVSLSLQYFVLFGDLCWIFGMITDVVLSYYNVLYIYELRHSYPAVCAAFAWLVTSLVYLTTTIHEELELRKELTGKGIRGGEDVTNNENLDKPEDEETRGAF